MKSVASEKTNSLRREPLVLIGKIRKLENTPGSTNQAPAIDKCEVPAPVQSGTILLNSRKGDIFPSNIKSPPSYRAKAKFAYTPCEPDELAFAKHEVIEIFGSSQVFLSYNSEMQIESICTEPIDTLLPWAEQCGMVDREHPWRTP